MLDNVFFQEGVVHAKGLLFWIEASFPQVVTIVTVQVADGADGLDKNLKFAGSLNHDSNPDLRGEFPETPAGCRIAFSEAIISGRTLAGQGREKGRASHLLFLKKKDVNALEL
jgi:hypothetical protein